MLQQDDRDNIVKNYLAGRALYRPETKTWDLESVKVVEYDDAGNITHEANPAAITHDSAMERNPLSASPARTCAQNFELAGTARLSAFQCRFPGNAARAFRDPPAIPNRVALDLSVVVFIAAPLGIGYSRRGILSSVAAAIVLVFAMNFLTHLFLALGRRRPRAGLDRGLDSEHHFCGDRGLPALFARHQSRSTPRFHLFAARPIVAR